jgi:hypothetical protein
MGAVLGSLRVWPLKSRDRLAQVGKRAKEYIADYSVEGTVKGTLEAVKDFLNLLISMKSWLSNIRIRNFLE